jgi:hypothetical protein
MLRLGLFSIAWAVSGGATHAGAGGYPHAVRHRPLPPPEIAYRDPTYLPPPPPVPVARVPRSLNLPLYNEPPRRF